MDKIKHIKNNIIQGSETIVQLLNILKEGELPSIYIKEANSEILNKMINGK